MAHQADQGGRIGAPTQNVPLVLDGHLDIPMSLGEPAPAGEAAPPSQSSLEKLAAGGVNAAVFCIYTPMRPVKPTLPDALDIAEHKLRAVLSLAAQHPEQLAIARTADEVETIAGQGRLAVILGFLNAYPFGRGLEKFESWFIRGVRIFGLTHAGHNAFADSSRPLAGEPVSIHGGLSKLGHAAIALLNDLGAVVDVSQLTSAGLAQAVRQSRTPVIASHSSLRSIIDVPRNLTDDEARAIAGTGGVIQAVAYPSYVVRPPATFAAAVGELRTQQGLQAAFESWTDGLPGLAPPAQRSLTLGVNRLLPPAKVADLVDLIDQLVALVGIDHVGIASDFNDGGGVEGWRDASETPNVTAELVRRGYGMDSLTKLWGGNLLRVMRACEAATR